MTRRLSMLAAATATALALIPAAAMAQTTPTSQQRTTMTEADAPLLGFTVTHEVKTAPDRASIGAGVVTQAPTAVEAMRQNATAMQRLIAALRAKGIAERDIQTSGINLSPQYDYSNRQDNQPPRLTGYQVTNTVRVTTADIANLGQLLDTLVSAGGNNLDGPNFFMADADAGMDEARTAALRSAGERAQVYARAAGYSRARLVSINEGGSYAEPPRPVMMARMVAADAAATPVQPGEVTRSLALSVQYRLER
jgi:hypothetical protein